jgi:predicted TIM-barrel fold metal-dependent hydrolase
VRALDGIGLPIFDVHLHMCRTGSDESRVYPRKGWHQSWYWANEEKISFYLDLWGIERVVVQNIMDTRRMVNQQLAASERTGRSPVSTDELAQQMRERVTRFNLWLCELSRREPRIIPFAMADPVLFGGGVVEEVSGAIQRGARGLKMHPNICGHLPVDPRAMPIYDFCESKNIPILTDTSGRTGADGIAWGYPSYWSDVLSSHRSLRLILAHLPNGRWDEMVELANKFENCWFDISGGFVDATHSPGSHNQLTAEEAPRILRKVGIERILFGSDAPAGEREITTSAVQLLQLDLRDDEKEAILYQNARKFFDVN